MLKKCGLILVIGLFIFIPQIQACENRQEAYRLAQLAYNDYVSGREASGENRFKQALSACRTSETARHIARQYFAMAVEEKVFEKRNFLYDRMLDYCLVGSKLVGLPSPLKDATVLTLQEGITHFEEVIGLYDEVRKIEEKNYKRTKDRRELRISLKYLQIRTRTLVALNALRKARAGQGRSD